MPSRSSCDAVAATVLTRLCAVVLGAAPLDGVRPAEVRATRRRPCNDRPRPQRALIVVGGLLAALGVLAGHLNRELIDGPSFVDNVDEIRRDANVSRAVGRVVSAGLIAANPDLVALRPLVDGVAINVAGSDLVSGATRLGAATGAEARSLCHGLCETGSTPFLEMLRDLRAWMSLHPDEVVTLFVENHVEPSLIAADVETSGLVPMIHEPVVGAQWPTLGQMIRSGRRLVVMVEDGDGGSVAPRLVDGFEHTQETPYTFPTVKSFSCESNRGPADAPLFLLNHWLSGFDTLVTDAQLVNSRDVLRPRAQHCQRDREQLPNFVAVNYVAIGDVAEVVDELNGVGT